ncbi:SRPBCC family protein [Rhodococcus sp. H29-C3]|uniref:aromatase/cyclase n=1 Tax=Rhodococcus sp. H29-C3 TaxID=3046307 RepID=UPI0024B8DDA8|nr:SRPBCC family protein [Rhodococcus sp. H29-C3]MDJ0362341.1 SRPBCC family protein [Rhodococcus sp. H29-C3]
MMHQTLHTVTVTVTVAAAAATVYEALSDVTLWPEIFTPTIHAEILGRDGERQSIKLWAMANGESKMWSSDRRLDNDKMTIDFQQTTPNHPIAFMSGRWSVNSLDERSCTVALDHSYSAVDNDASALEWIGRAVDTNSTVELAALKTYCEEKGTSEGPFKFSDSVESSADPARIFEFLDRGDLWGERLAHVPSVSMETSDGGLQRLKMVTVTHDGDSHVTESIRISQPPARLLYKQITLPELLTLHTGVWTIAPAGELWKVTSQHTVRIDASKIHAVLGNQATLRDAQELVRRNLGNNSLLTLKAAAKWAAEFARA